MADTSITGKLSRLRNLPRIQAINHFISSPAYIALIGLLTVISNLFGAELLVYTTFVAFGIYICLFCNDCLSIMPIVICCYIAPSTQNNPGSNKDSIFFPQNGGIYLIALGVLFVIALIFRLASDPDLGGKRFFSQKRKLLAGMLILGASYYLSGIGYEKYGELALRNLTFATVQFASVAACYYVFAGAVRWDKAPKDFFCWVGLMVGAVVLAEILGIYLSGKAIVNGTIRWSNIVTGWGIHNNMGGMLAMMIPFPFYFANRSSKGWCFHLLAAAYMAGVCMTCSRTSMLFGGLVYGGCLIYTLIRSRSKWAWLLYAVAAVIAVLVFHKALYSIFRDLFEKGLSLSNRDTIYREGFKQFLNYPVFGGTFYAIDYPMIEFSTVGAFSAFFPPRWHNTIIQMLASCGSVGLIAYCIHRAQTVWLFVKQRTFEKTFIGLSILVLLGTSLLDCHFFNVGPTLFYSMALIFAEKTQKV